MEEVKNNFQVILRNCFSKVLQKYVRKIQKLFFDEVFITGIISVAAASGYLFAETQFPALKYAIAESPSGLHSW